MEIIWNFVLKGGFTMIPLGLCSLVGLAIVIEKTISLQRKRIIIPEVVSVLESIASPEDVSLAISVCKKHDGPLPNIARTALENRLLPQQEMKETILDQSRQEIRVLERGLVALETVAAISPLLGLFGTVVGILKIFNVISRLGVGQASALSVGISEALITTIVGLAIGIPAVVAYNYFAHRAENLILDIEKYTSAVMNKIRSFSRVNQELEESY